MSKGPWGRDRFVAGFGVIVLLPHAPPGITIEEIAAEIRPEGSEAARKKFVSRLLADLRAAGFEIVSSVSADGKRGHYIVHLDDFLGKLGLL